MRNKKVIIESNNIIEVNNRKEDRIEFEQMLHIEYLAHYIPNVSIFTYLGTKLYELFIV